jgi:hypothetical protein
MSKPDLIRRQEALDATRAKFKGKPLVLGTYDCIKVMRFHLVKMGHKGLPSPGRYTNALGAKRALADVMEKLTGKRPKKPTFEELGDALLPRIPPAAMLPGDIALVPEDEDGGVGLGGAMVVFIGRKFMSWHPDVEWLADIEPKIEQPFLAAWRA